MRPAVGLALARCRIRWLGEWIRQRSLSGSGVAQARALHDDVAYQEGAKSLVVTVRCGYKCGMMKLGWLRTIILIMWRMRPAEGLALARCRIRWPSIWIRQRSLSRSGVAQARALHDDVAYQEGVKSWFTADRQRLGGYFMGHSPMRVSTSGMRRWVSAMATSIFW